MSNYTHLNTCREIKPIKTQKRNNIQAKDMKDKKYFIQTK